MKYTSPLAKVERNNKIVKDHLEGKSFYKIAKELGLTEARVGTIFHVATDNKYKKTLVLKAGE